MEVEVLNMKDEEVNKKSMNMNLKNSKQILGLIPIEPKCNIICIIVLFYYNVIVYPVIN